jgi:hypothetical protein
MKGKLLLVTLGCALSCASKVRPPILSELDAVRARPTMAETRRLAPQGHQQAERLFERAEAAWEEGQIAGSQIAAERALATYTRAEVLARIARAEQGLQASQEQLARLEQTQAELTSKQKTAAAELADLDLRLGIERDLEPIAPTTGSTPEREAARQRAARSTLAEAQLLCASASVLSPGSHATEALLSAIDELYGRLESTTVAVPVDQALGMRSRCLARLTEIRRPLQQASPVSTASDRLFVELGEAQFSPSRDDRGISVVLRQVFEKNAVSETAKRQLTELGVLARSHSTGLLVVLHDAKGEPTSSSQKQLPKLSELLRAAGAPSVQPYAVGGRLPEVATTTGTGQNTQRLELIFVTSN